LDKPMKIDRVDLRYIIVVIFLILQTYLMTTGHGKLDSDVLNLNQAASQIVRQCVKP